MRTLPIGAKARASSVASAANLGPGFDSLGIAVDWRDEVFAEVVRGPDSAECLGVPDLPTDDTNLIIKCIRFGLDRLGVAAPGLFVRTEITAPFGKGLGSSAAATVTGLALAWKLARPDHDIDHEWLLALGTEIEGHGDNIAPAVYGGATLVFGTPMRAIRLEVDPRIRLAVYLPQESFSTEAARAALPDQVTRAAAVANLAAAGALVHSLAREPDLLLPATEDRLHQEARSALMPATAGALAQLRVAGYAAAISGAGPSLLVLGTADSLGHLPDIPGFTLARPEIGGPVAAWGSWDSIYS